jgi:hypothetical protein
MEVVILMLLGVGKLMEEQKLQIMMELAQVMYKQIKMLVFLLLDTQELEVH